MRRIRNVRLAKAAVVVACALLAGVAAVRATQVIPLTDQQLVARSQLIIEGRVTGVSSAWNAGQTQIHTTVEIAVQEVLKGSLVRGHQTVTLRMLGGTVGDMTMLIVDAPRFFQGDELLLMLHPDYQQVLLPVVGFNQGALRIKTDLATGTRMIPARKTTRNEFVKKVRGIIATQIVQEKQNVGAAQTEGDADGN